MQSLHNWVDQVLADTRLLGMGHAEKAAVSDLGLGWIYYGLTRVIKPATAVVIGSHRGFAPLMIARALADDGPSGRLIFIDPSLVDSFWRDPVAVQAHFAHFGLTNVEHHCLTTQDFVKTDAYRSLTEVGLVFIDGYHSHEQARFDYDAFEPFVHERGTFLFHDSIAIKTSRIYGADKAYEHRVRELIDIFRLDPKLQVFDLPYGAGVTLVRKAGHPEILFA